MVNASETLASVANSDPIPVDWKASSFQVSVAVKVTGTLTYSVQHTFDDPYASAAPVWFDHATLVGATANADGNYFSPVKAVRLSVTAYTSGGAELIVLQGDS